MPDVWGDDDLYKRRAAAKHRRKKAAKRKRARARHKRSGCQGIMVGLVAGCVLWAVLLVPLILWGPL